ncbi:long-chain acyl-CoA synthetase [Nematocida sp. LUAm3]|nr:long-chain acyl-CoA synthetase [Nematocida sp. LUAm3]KAI5174934.1 long-chain acyl-CoA synthetase [Nematocida sp. LUAm2]KAI5177467.1 long-chain acyl-CoA synthetase [Nematocida sp. LUAm1]
MGYMNYQMIKEKTSLSPEEETDVYIHPLVVKEYKGHLLEEIDGISTLYEALEKVASTGGEINFLGRITEDEQIEYFTYKEVRRFAEEVASFLLKHIETQKAIIGICSENRPEWLITEHASYFFRGINCPIYNSFGWSAVKHIIQETEMKIIFISSKCLQKIISGVENEIEEITLPKLFVLMDPPTETEEAFLKNRGAEFEYFWNIVERCKKLKLTNVPKRQEEEGKEKNKQKTKEKTKTSTKYSFLPPRPEDISTICYTSGTTGAPKGAMLTHRNFISVAGSFNILSKEGAVFTIQEGNRYLSFLPLAHVFERIVESALLLCKCTIIYYRGVPKNLQKDIEIVKPHYFVGVPRAYNSIKSAIETKAQEKGKIANFLFNTSLKLCMHFRNRYVREIFGKTIFRTIRKTFGNSIICMLSGSAPLSVSTAEFFEIIFNCSVIEGYGQTETTAGNITTQMNTTEKGIIGIPFPSNRIKLVSRPESNAFAKNNQGEIYMHGPAVFLGYYKKDALTKEVFQSSPKDTKNASKAKKEANSSEEEEEFVLDPKIYNVHGDKWIKTGDIAEITEKGNLKIIGRSKEIFKLSQGEYIIPEKIETLFLSRKVEYLEDLTIVGDSTKDYVVGICVIKPNISDLQKLQVKEAIARAGEKLVSSGELIKIELPKKLLFTQEPFTIDNGLLTPSIKKIRSKIYTLFSKEIQKAYEE